MNFRTLLLIAVAGLAGLAVVAGLAGCPDEVDIDFDCEEHEHCLEDEACLDGVCVDEPVEGQSCPEDQAGKRYEELLCESGEWIEFESPAAPTIDSVNADPPTVDPEGVIELSVEATVAEDQELTYEWSAPEDWDLQADDEAIVDVVAPDDWGRTATIEVVLSDSYDQSDSGQVTVSTHEPGGPEIVATDVEPQPAMPDSIQTVTVEGDHPEGMALTYEWVVPGDWTAQNDGEDGVLDLLTPDEHDVSEQIAVTVSDDADREATTTVDVATRTNPGPTIDELEADETVLEPEQTTAVVVETSHELDHDIDEYQWSIEGGEGDWELIEDVDDIGDAEDENAVVEVVAGEEYEDDVDVSVRVFGEYDRTDQKEVTLTTEPLDNDPPTIEELYADDDPVEPEETTEVHVEAEDEFELDYEWSIDSDDDWDIEETDEETTAELTAPDEYDSTVDVTVQVLDPYDESDEETIEVRTVTQQNEPPEIEELEVDETPIGPEETTTAWVEATDPFGQDLDYTWQIDDGWTIDSDVDDDETTAEVTEPDQFGASAQITVTVEDEDHTVEDDVTVETVVNDGPNVDVVAPEQPLDIEETVDVEADVDHPDGHDVPTYQWELNNNEHDWEIVGDDTEPTIELQAAGRPESSVDVEVTVTDEYDLSETDEAPVETVANEGPEITVVEPEGGEGVVDPDEAVDLEVSTSHDQGFDDGIGVQWEFGNDSEGWSFGDDGIGHAVSAVAPDEPGVSVDVTATAEDEFGGEKEAKVELETPANGGPTIEFIDAPDEGELEVRPDEEVGLSVETGHPQDYDDDEEVEWWFENEEYDWSFEGDDHTGENATVQVPNEPGASADVVVEVEDDYEETESTHVELWTPANDGPTIEFVDFPEDGEVEADEEVDLKVETGHPQDYDEQEHVEWKFEDQDSGEDEWSFVDGEDTGYEVTVQAPHEPEAWADVKATVTDDYEETESVTDRLETPENEGPKITEDVSADPPEVEPGEQTTVSVQASHPQGYGTYYDWELNDQTHDGWEIIEDNDDEIVLQSPDEPLESVEVAVTVTDDYDGEAEDDTTVETINLGPIVDELEAEDEPLPPERTTQVEVEHGHEHGFDIVDVDWELNNQDWNYENAQNRDEIIDVTSPDDSASKVEVTVTLEDEEGETESDSLLLETYDHEGPTVQGLDYPLGSPPFEPDANFEIDAEVDEGDAEDVDFLWSIAPDEDWELQYEKTPDTTNNGESADEFDSSAQLEVTAVDEWDFQDTYDDKVYTLSETPDDFDFGEEADDVRPGDFVVSDVAQVEGFDVELTAECLGGEAEYCQLRHREDEDDDWSDWQQDPIDEVEEGDHLQVQLQAPWEFDDIRQIAVELGETTSDGWGLRTRDEWRGERHFGTCQSTGAEGPTASDCREVYQGTKLEDDLEGVDEGIQQWVVPVDGAYRIVAFGAEGAGGSSYHGLGAMSAGTVDLEAGQTLEIMVGQSGTSAEVPDIGHLATGGGGTFVARNGTPLAVGGGGGGDIDHYDNVADGSDEEQGRDGAVPDLTYGGFSQGGDPQQGGEEMTIVDGYLTLVVAGGGGGWSGDGGGDDLGGESFLNGGQGGEQHPDDDYYQPGGFGGGAGGYLHEQDDDVMAICTGGGGYGGGGSSVYGGEELEDVECSGGGGGSYLAEEAWDGEVLSGEHASSGQVLIDYVDEK